MFRLIKLELGQKRLGGYVLATLVISGILIGFCYLFVSIPSLRASSELEEMIMEIAAAVFNNYESIIAIISILAMFCFSVLSATALSRLVVSDYTGKMANLLFAYPVDRSKLFISKVLVVFGFTILAMFISSAVVFGIFFMIESNFPLVSEGVLSAELIASTARTVVVLSVLSVSVGLISLWFGFKRKSVSATLILAYTLEPVNI